MTDIKLDEIPGLLKSGKLSFSQACIAVYKRIYCEPALFDLLEMDEDERSDFLLYFLQKKIPTMIRNYNPQITAFGSYVYTVVRIAKIDYLQQQDRKKNMSKTYIYESIIEYDEFIARSQKSPSKISDEIKGYVPRSEEEKIPSLVYKRFFKKEPHRLCVAESRERKLKHGILILALKSAWYINDEQIQKVSNYCKISSDILSTTVCTLKANLINKALFREEIQNNRAKAYCLINTYEQQIRNLGTYDGLPKFERIERRLEFQKRNFNSKNKLLQSGKFKIAPTNSEIAKVIGVKNSLIANTLSKFRQLKFTEEESESLS